MNKKFVKSMVAMFALISNLYGQEIVSDPLLEAMSDMIYGQQITDYLVKIEELYQTYDLITHNIEQVENQVKQIQSMVERASTIPTQAKNIWKSLDDDYEDIDWQNYDWEEAKKTWNALDVRDEIKDVNKWCDDQITLCRKMQDTLQQPCLSSDGKNFYSVADLCGKGDPNKSIATAFNESWGYMTESMKKSVNDTADTFTEAEKKAILRRYGISPENYAYVKNVEFVLMDSAQNAINNVQADARELSNNHKAGKISKWLAEAYSKADSNGNIPEATLNQVSAHIAHEIGLGLIEVQNKMDDLLSFIAEGKIEQIQKETAKENEEISKRENQKILQKKVSATFFSDQNYR